MNRKIIFLDCDGTLLDVSRGMNTISEKTKFAIKKLQENGHLVFISSGRRLPVMPQDIINANPTGYIAACGAICLANGKEIFSRSFSDYDIEIIKDFCDRNNGVYMLENQEKIWTKDLKNKTFEKFCDTWKLEKSIFSDLMTPKQRFQMIMVAFNNERTCDSFQELFKNKFEIKRHYVFTSFDIMQKGISKAKGVKEILKYYSIDKKDAYAFGDEINDIEMLQEVENSYCMENGNPKVKDVAKFIAPDVLEDGFYQIMIKEKLI